MQGPAPRTLANFDEETLEAIAALEALRAFWNQKAVRVALEQLQDGLQRCGWATIPDDTCRDLLSMLQPIARRLRRAKGGWLTILMGAAGAIAPAALGVDRVFAIIFSGPSIVVFLWSAIRERTVAGPCALAEQLCDKLSDQIDGPLSASKQ